MPFFSLCELLEYRGVTGSTFGNNNLTLRVIEAFSPLSQNTGGVLRPPPFKGWAKYCKPVPRVEPADIGGAPSDQGLTLVPWEASVLACTLRGVY